MSREKLPSWKAEGGSRRRPRSRGSYTRCSPAEYMSTSRFAGPPARRPLTSQWTTRWRSCSRSWVHTMRGLWQRSTARAPAAQLTSDSDTTELPAVEDPDGPDREGGSLGAQRDPGIRYRVGLARWEGDCQGKVVTNLRTEGQQSLEGEE